MKYDNLIWMKLNEISRYWAARELTSISLSENRLLLNAPFSADAFTIKINSSIRNPAIKNEGDQLIPLSRVSNRKAIKPDTWYSDETDSIICFNLVKGSSELIFS